MCIMNIIILICSILPYKKITFNSFHNKKKNKYQLILNFYDNLNVVTSNCIPNIEIIEFSKI